MKTTKDFADLKGFLERLSKIEIGLKLEGVPKFYIPNWPKETTVKIKLGRRKYTYIRKSEKTDSYELARGWKKINVEIRNDGNIVFYIKRRKRDKDYSSNVDDRQERGSALLLFQQFKEEIFRKTIETFERDVKKQNHVNETIKKAFEQFIPYLAADKSSD